MEKRLNQFVIGEKGCVRRVEVEGLMRRRLLDMGVISGTEIELKLIAPLGDPLEIKLRGFHLILRKNEAEKVVMEVEK